MITPRFQLSQDDQFLYVSVYAPFTNLDETEIFMDEREFRFFSRPYYLRLHLPAEVVEGEGAGGEYRADTASFWIKCPKVREGEVFEGLDMLTKLLTPPGATQVAGGGIEVINSGDTADTAHEPNNHPGDDHDDEDDDINWYYEQTLPDDLDSPAVVVGDGDRLRDYGYGFNGSRVDVFTQLMAEFGELLDIKDPDTKRLAERRTEAAEVEAAKFISDHYLCDLYESEEINHLLSYQCSWTKAMGREGEVDRQHPALAFSTQEQEALLGLPRKQLSVGEGERVGVFATLVEILFGFCYDNRITQGETCSESGWCVARLSSSLSSCLRPSSLRQAVRSCVRRSLVYPLYRHWDLSVRVMRDVASLVGVGRAAVLKALLGVMRLFSEREGYYIFSQLYIQDYATWVQTVPESHFSSLGEALNTIIKGLTKRDVDLELDELEAAADLAVKEEAGAGTGGVQKETEESGKGKDGERGEKDVLADICSQMEDRLAISDSDDDDSTDDDSSSEQDSDDDSEDDNSDDDGSDDDAADSTGKAEESKTSDSIHISTVADPKVMAKPCIQVLESLESVPDVPEVTVQSDIKDE